MTEGGEAHWEVLERILFLYAKLNPGQGYVQGMNEIVGPIYHTFACDPDHTWRGVYYNVHIISRIIHKTIFTNDINTINEITSINCLLSKSCMHYVYIFITL